MGVLYDLASMAKKMSGGVPISESILSDFLQKVTQTEKRGERKTKNAEEKKTA